MRIIAIVPALPVMLIISAVLIMTVIAIVAVVGVARVVGAVRVVLDLVTGRRAAKGNMALAGSKVTRGQNRSEFPGFTPTGRNVRVFVYGTLKSGLGNNCRLAEFGARSLGSARLSDSSYVLVNGYSYPYAVPINSEQRDLLTDQGITTYLIGELFECDEGVMTYSLDRLEGYPYHYNRSEVQVALRYSDNSKMTAWMYHRNELLCDGEPVCEDGEWWPSIRTVEVELSTEQV